jgi:hypothetical protein
VVSDGDDALARGTEPRPGQQQKKGREWQMTADLGELECFVVRELIFFSAVVLYTPKAIQ